MDLDEAAEELYAASPDEFVERRTALVARARSAKDRPLVKAIGQLRRPTRSAWMVNLLSRQADDELAELLQLGAALAEAQQRGDGAGLRRLSAERHTTLDALTRRSVRLAADAGHAATEASRAEVASTLTAALADPEVAGLVREGRVVQPAAYGGFGPMSLFAVPAPVEEPDPEPETQPHPEPEPDPEPQPDPRLQQAEAAVEDAEHALDEARTAAEEAEQDADDATSAADALADRVAELRSELAAAEEEERTAGDTARAARRRHQQARQAAGAAEQAVEEARRAAAELASAEAAP